MEKLSGIKAHTIRIWEQRYELLTPKRTDTNIRYYEDEDLRFLLNVVLLKNNGIKISQIAKMNADEIAAKVADFSEVSYEFRTQLDALTISMMEMDEYKFDRILSANIKQLGFERSMLEVVLPFLEKLGVLWMTGSIQPVQENFISFLLRRKLAAAIDALPIQPKSKKPSFLLFQPHGERQELSLLFLCYLLRIRHHNVSYVGQDVKLYDLKDAHRILEPNYMITIISEQFTGQSVHQYIQDLEQTFPQTTFLLSGYQVIVNGVKNTKQVKVLHSLHEMIGFIEKLCPSPVKIA